MASGKVLFSPCVPHGGCDPSWYNKVYQELDFALIQETKGFDSIWGTFNLEWLLVSAMTLAIFVINP